MGERIVIHASARKVRPDEVAEVLQMIADEDTSLHILGEPMPALAWAERHGRPGYDSSRIDHHKWAWPLTDIQRFAHPIPCRGQQGFWKWPEGLE